MCNQRREEEWSKDLVFHIRESENLIIKDEGRHAVDQITYCYNGISLEVKRNIVVKKKGTGNFNQVSVISFGDTILLWCVRARYLMKNTL